jgi:choline dehydrogenase-like flavoprotein
LKEPIHTDVLILGCGIAGGTAALELAEAGLEVLIVTRADRPQESNTYWAQGGIIFKGEDDSPGLLARDIQHAGDGLCHDQAVEILARSGPELVQSILLDKLRVPFDRKPDGNLALGREGGHSLPRILHATDATGRAIEDSLVAALEQHPRVRFLTGHTAVDLLTPAHHGRDRRAIYDPLSCVGAYVGRSSCAPPTRWVRAATAWPWRTAPARASSTPSTCSSTPRRSTTAMRRASSSPRRCAARVHGWWTSGARRSWTATMRSGRTSRRATSWPAASTPRSSGAA